MVRCVLRGILAGSALAAVVSSFRNSGSSISIVRRLPTADDEARLAGIIAFELVSRVYNWLASLGPGALYGSSRRPACR